jgi:hypothetical protein
MPGPASYWPTRISAPFESGIMARLLLHHVWAGWAYSILAGVAALA